MSHITETPPPPTSSISAEPLKLGSTRPPHAQRPETGDRRRAPMWEEGLGLQACMATWRCDPAQGPNTPQPRGCEGGGNRDHNINCPNAPWHGGFLKQHALGLIFICQEHITTMYETHNHVFDAHIPSFVRATPCASNILQTTNSMTVYSGSHSSPRPSTRPTAHSPAHHPAESPRRDYCTCPKPFPHHRPLYMP